MKQLKNGWYVPDGDLKVTKHLDLDESMLLPSYEQRHRDTVLEHIPQKNVLIDVGANVGIWSIAMKSHFKHIIAYEPSRRNLECLELNVDNSIEIRKFAVGDQVGSVNFYDQIKNCGDSKVVPTVGEYTYEVSMVRLDDEKIQNCSLIKIDVQGLELPVIQGALELIKTQQPWIYVEMNEDVDIICKLLEELDYEMIRNKSKRVMIWAPKSGPMSPVNKEIFGRWLGPGPYKPLVVAID